MQAQLINKYSIGVAGFQEVDKFISRNNKDMLAAFVAAGAMEHSFFRKAIDLSKGEYGGGIIFKTAPTAQGGDCGRRDTIQGDSGQF